MFRQLGCLYLAVGRGLASAAHLESAVLTTKKQLTLEAADIMANTALAEAKAKQFKDISVTVLDASGRILVSKTQPGCPRLVPALATAKAGAVIGTHANSRALKDKYLPDRMAQLLAMTTVSGNTGTDFAAVPGGILCRDAEGSVVAAIGVSGATADEDEHCGVVGAQAVGLVTEPAASALS